MCDVYIIRTKPYFFNQTTSLNGLWTFASFLWTLLWSSSQRFCWSVFRYHGNTNRGMFLHSKVSWQFLDFWDFKLSNIEFCTLVITPQMKFGGCICFTLSICLFVCLSVCPSVCSPSVDMILSMHVQIGVFICPCMFQEMGAWTFPKIVHWLLIIWRCAPWIFILIVFFLNKNFVFTIMIYNNFHSEHWQWGRGASNTFCRFNKVQFYYAHVWFSFINLSY